MVVSPMEFDWQCSGNCILLRTYVCSTTVTLFAVRFAKD